MQRATAPLAFLLLLLLQSLHIHAFLTSPPALLNAISTSGTILFAQKGPSRSIFKQKKKENLIPNVQSFHNQRRNFHYNHTIIESRMEKLEIASQQGNTLDFSVHLKFLSNKLYISFLVREKLVAMLTRMLEYFEPQFTGSLFFSLSELGIKANHSQFRDITEKYIDRYFETDFNRTQTRILAFLASMNKFNYAKVLSVPKFAADSFPAEHWQLVQRRKEQIVQLTRELLAQGIDEKQFLTLTASLGQLTLRWADLPADVQRELMASLRRLREKFDGMYVPLLVFNLGRLEVPREGHDEEMAALLAMAERMFRWVHKHRDKYKQCTIIVSQP